MEAYESKKFNIEKFTTHLVVAMEDYRKKRNEYLGKEKNADLEKAINEAFIEVAKVCADALRISQEKKKVIQIIEEQIHKFALDYKKPLFLAATYIEFWQQIALELAKSEEEEQPIVDEIIGQTYSEVDQIK